MPWWVALVLAAFIGVSAYNYGFKQGLTAAPETADAVKKAASADLELEKIRLLSIQRAAPDPFLCLPIILDGSVDLDEFCRVRIGEMAKEAAEFKDEMNQDREQDVGR